MYNSILFNAPAPIEMVEWTIAEQMGWTLPEVRAITLRDLRNYFQIMDGKTKAMETKR